MIPAALALSSCTYPKSVGEAGTGTDAGSDTTIDAGQSSTDTGQSSATDPLTSSTTDATDGGEATDTGTEVTGVVTVTGDDSATGDDSSTGDRPELPAGMCWSENHGEYWCECTATNTQACGDGGVSVCFAQDDFVVTHEKWGPCGECAPGDEMPCDIEDAPGRRFCDVSDVWVDDIDELPTPAWGACILEADIACEPGDSQMCEGGGGTQECVVDEQGAPQWTAC